MVNSIAQIDDNYFSVDSVNETVIDIAQVHDCDRNGRLLGFVLVHLPCLQSEVASDKNGRNSLENLLFEQEPFFPELNQLDELDSVGYLLI